MAELSHGKGSPLPRGPLALLRSSRLVALLVPLVAGLVVLTGCSSSQADGQQKKQQQVSKYASYIATVKKSLNKVDVYDHPHDAEPAWRLSNPNRYGARRVFLIEGENKKWLKVLLPIRPNGTKGWIHKSDVSLSRTTYRVEIALSAHQITVHKGKKKVLQGPIAVGTGQAPTPGGEYYITELVKSPNPNGDYGPYVFGLSAYSQKYERYAGGVGEIGIHGTNKPQLLGKNVSHGCIRMSNKDIKKLAGMLPLGTPVTIKK